MNTKILFFILTLYFPLSVNAQYEGGIGKGDASAISYIPPPAIDMFSGGIGKGDVSINSNNSVLSPFAVYSGSLGKGDVSVGLNDIPLPVTISLFTAIAERNNVHLSWTTESELNNSGFELERRIAKDSIVWEKIIFVQGIGTSNRPVKYNYEDMKLKKGSYQYRLKQIDFNGNFEYYTLDNDVVVGTPKDFRVSQNYPNPSNPKSKIDYELPVNGKLTIKVYDIIGREVVTLIDEYKEAGYYTVDYDGSNLASGVYIYRINAEGQGKSFNKILKMVLLK